MEIDTNYTVTPDGVYIAYQVLGYGPIDVVWQLDWPGNIDMECEDPVSGPWIREIASFARVIMHDRRGIGLSSRNVALPNLETRVSDLLTVMDSVGSERPILTGIFESGAPNVLLAASTWPWPWPGPVENLAEVATEVFTSALKCSEWRWVRTRKTPYRPGDAPRTGSILVGLVSEGSESGGRFEASVARWRAIVRALTAQPSISTDAGSPGPREGWAAFSVRLNPRCDRRPSGGDGWRDEATRDAFPSGLEIRGRRRRVDPSLSAAHALETRM